MGSEKSPWKVGKVNINKVLGSSKDRALRQKKQDKLIKLTGEYAQRVKQGEKPEAVQKAMKDQFKEVENG